MTIDELPYIMVRCLLPTIVVELVVTIIIGIKGKKDILNISILQEKWLIILFRKKVKKMKKIFYLLTMLLLIPISVFADGASPSVSEYSAYVSNREGAILNPFYSSNNKTTVAPFETIFTIHEERTIDGVYYALVEYNGDNWLCKTSDLTLLTEKREPDKNSFNQVESPHKLYVYKDGAYLYKGPSKIYSKVSEEQIPVGTTLSYKYYDGLFAYVSYNGKSGWVFIYPHIDDNIYNPYQEASSVATIPRHTTAFTVIDTELKDDNGNGTGIIVPAFTEVKINYTLHDNFYETNITYNNKTGWLSTLMLPNIDKQTIYVGKDIKYYKECDMNNEDYYCELKNIIGTIPKNTELNIEYTKYYWETTFYYISYNGKKGWVMGIEPGSDYIALSQKDNTFIPERDLPVYDKIDGDITKFSITKGKSYSCKYSFGYNDWQYIVTNEFSGWVKDENSVEPQPITTKKDERLIEPLSRSTTILLALLAAVIVSATAFTTIILVNKKKERRIQKNS